MAIIFGLDGVLLDTLGDAVTLQPGARTAIEIAAADAWAIVTSTAQQRARQHLATLGCDVPPIVVGGDDVTGAKPASDGYVVAAARLGVPPRLCLVVEDGPDGIEAAHAAGTLVLAVATTRPREMLAGADIVVDDLPAAIDLLQNWVDESNPSRR